MKTFETEKHNIPEGATHYSNETQGAYFAWYKKVNHCNFLWCGDVAGKWEVMVNQEEFDEHDVKLIPKPRTKTEYELLCNSSFNVWGLKDLLESGSLFYFINDEYRPVSVGSDIFAIEHFLSGHIYRKV